MTISVVYVKRRRSQWGNRVIDGGRGMESESPSPLRPRLGRWSVGGDTMRVHGSLDGLRNGRHTVAMEGKERQGHGGSGGLRDC
jgi:hypothetical protein